MDSEKRKEQKRLAAQRYRERHPEKVKLRNKEQYERNKEKRKEYQKQYVENNKKRIVVRAKIRYEKNKDTLLSGMKEFRKNNKELVAKRERKYDLWTKYRITPEQLEQMWEQQDGRCANRKCGDFLTTGKSGYCVDHCHSTNRVRGLLCRTCNLALGHVQDSEPKLIGLAEYLYKNRTI